MPKLSAEERHKRQRAKMQQAETTITTFIQPKSPQRIALEAAQAEGFPARLENNVLQFYTTDEDEKKKIREWIAANYNYSWGFPGKDLKDATNSFVDGNGARAGAERSLESTQQD